jgi:hypothetical protein
LFICLHIKGRDTSNGAFIDVPSALMRFSVMSDLLYIYINDIVDNLISWPWSYGSWIYNYLCNKYLSPLMLWVRKPIRAMCTTLCDKVCQWLATGRWFSQGTLVSLTNKTDRHDIAEILLKVVLNTIKPNQTISYLFMRMTFHSAISTVMNYR